MFERKIKESGKMKVKEKKRIRGVRKFKEWKFELRRRKERMV